LLLNKLEVLANRCYVIDDKLKNLQGAASVGMQTVWVKREAPDAAYQPDWEIEYLIELKYIL
jgi:FMN phosphatase YigB (HAD superfamily)